MVPYGGESHHPLGEGQEHMACGSKGAERHPPLGVIAKNTMVVWFLRESKGSQLFEPDNQQQSWCV
ncbi:hypothetical protein FORC53_4699 [Vibrio vulnificus]|uniref:Uncharacterized protein n=1 Tax=Vibrio vulnificus TaxID=672 RepID=A0AAN1UF67_VIBVL|nr:hypothetical protein FORC53_4699 [Vibrio vulnificus]